MTNKVEKINEFFSSITKFAMAESVGLIGMLSLFVGCSMQFTIGIALIVNGVLFISTAVVSAYRS